MKIYTKTGDKGQTSLLGGSRVSKAHWRIETYGLVDELNSVLGLASSELHESEKVHSLEFSLPLKSEIHNIQNRLFNIGSHLACENEKASRMLPPL